MPGNDPHTRMGDPAMSVLSSRPTLGGRLPRPHHIPRPRLILVAATAALLATGITVGLVLSLDGASTPATEDLLPLAPDTDIAPGAVQLEPGDTPPMSAWCAREAR